MGVVSLCLFCHDASTDMQYGLLGSTRDLALRSYVELTVQSHNVYVSTSLDERNMIVPKLYR